MSDEVVEDFDLDTELLSTEVEDTPEVPVEDVAPEAPVQEDFFAEIAQNFHVDLSQKYKTKDEAIKGLVNAYSMVGKRDEEAEIGKQLLTNPQAVYEVLAKRYSKPAEAPVEDSKKNPDWNDEWLEHFDPETMAPKPGADPNVVTKVRRYQKFVQDQGKRLIHNPVDVLLESGGDKLRELIREEATRIADQRFQSVEQERYGRAMQEQAASLAHKEASWVFDGGKLDSGKLTKEGEVLKKHLAVLSAVNPDTGSPVIQDLAMQMEMAKARTIIELGYNPAATASKSAQQRQTRPAAAARRPNTASRTPAVDDPWPAGTDLAKELLAIIDPGEQK
jgi:hypothetical protein